ncbi:MAG: hypothetical protein KatS3mg102_0692 [Planctomycetota bacterium]|nr:MAG: hypothetical protein KatS3mg102_0692 [Planctomycetota bacterium]
MVLRIPVSVALPFPVLVVGPIGRSLAGRTALALLSQIGARAWSELPPRPRATPIS